VALMDGVALRLAEADDITSVAGLFARSRAVALPFLPVLHSPAEDIAFFASRRERALMTLAVRGDTLVGFMVEDQGWIEQLYLEPERRGLGVGSLLVNAAKQRHKRLQLWCFADNHAGRAFYTRHGFVEIARTAGDNEEGQPDILFGWPAQD
jgi:GNAT superfamily N-acetyltransferase